MNEGQQSIGASLKSASSTKRQKIMTDMESCIDRLQQIQRRLLIHNDSIFGGSPPAPDVANTVMHDEDCFLAIRDNRNDTVSGLINDIETQVSRLEAF